ncbi:RNA polymerase sigma-70 factor [Bacteroides reticulotermitis]|mgnify:FL=1|uniref:RNA polymerase ECF-type sigma factor n=2 Tax=Bacteroides reticulotermitis TaxID=1133319 RepID=W4UT32_9BACE|nr:RNA polymerase sigma-70 factor [Bacteroides reticulotermitis]MBB4045119.1 RNA polymerase sigma-70 factor (ECF subfamily) [Bacteroides reticulotermitis]GAE83932.1 RNA polymerase ECF-type sigma factor [Bacteroides reticulotermitis JCM 10512]
MGFSELYLAYYAKLVRFATVFVILEEDAENIIQDVFTELWMKSDCLDQIENINAYLYRLVRNRCLDHLKHKVFEQKYAKNMQTSFETELNLKLQSLDSFDTCLVSEEKEITKKIHAAINSLPDRCREIFMLSRFDGLKYKEISECLGISINTVECQMSIALKKLRVKLQVCRAA